MPMNAPSSKLWNGHLSIGGNRDPREIVAGLEMEEPPIY